VPLYAHVRETLDQRGQRDSIEIVYMKFFAYNGSYRVLVHRSDMLFPLEVPMSGAWMQ